MTTALRAESPAERFARRQAERDAARRPRVHPVTALPPRPAARRPTRLVRAADVAARTLAVSTMRRWWAAQYAAVTADLVQRQGVTATAHQLGESTQATHNRLAVHGLSACNPVLHAEDYERRHGLTSRSRWPRTGDEQRGTR